MVHPAWILSFVIQIFRMEERAVAIRSQAPVPTVFWDPLPASYLPVLFPRSFHSVSPLLPLRHPHCHMPDLRLSFPVPLFPNTASYIPLSVFLSHSNHQQPPFSHLSGKNPLQQIHSRRVYSPYNQIPVPPAFLHHNPYSFYPVITGDTDQISGTGTLPVYGGMHHGQLLPPVPCSCRFL